MEKLVDNKYMYERILNKNTVIAVNNDNKKKEISRMFDGRQQALFKSTEVMFIYFGLIR